MGIPKTLYCMIVSIKYRDVSTRDDDIDEETVGQWFSHQLLTKVTNSTAKFSEVYCCYNCIVMSLDIPHVGLTRG